MSYEREKRIQSFIKNYVEDLLDDRVAIFAGAGLSVGVGAVSWKELLREAADDIGIDVDKEYDLVSVAQYIYNESNSRTKITKLIKNHIQRKGEVTENHKILSNLPIKTFWTTNYDEYLEKSFEQKNKIYDVKKSVQDLSSEVKNSEVTIYKMHGDINRAYDAVLIKDDYEVYDKKNELFTQALKGDLISKTFLFIGFSFDDPNLENILSRVRIMLEGNNRTHYCFFKEVSIEDYEYQKITNKEDREVAWKYARNKQYLKIKDLERYGIKSILVKEYSDITSILRKIEKLYLSKNIFMSGSFVDTEKYYIDGKVESFVEKISTKLHEEDYKITSGYGLGIGSSVITGVLRGSEITGKENLDRILCLKPFPLHIEDDTQRKKVWHSYRENMIGNCGTAIFLLGNKVENGKLVMADGVKKEFEIAKAKGLNLIPIGSSGYISKKLHKDVLDNFEQYYPNSSKRLYKAFKKLGKKNLSQEKVIENILSFLKLLRAYHYEF
ncbi:SIR2 family protein (plasmid) [Bacillus tropicus]|uniref:SIR2 family protein n=1 Tax=Bacillus tropicus TaxID=2026188 RepID=UPI002003D26C|nr:SIR2 family protein [Bacillus tropicus]UOK49057.1 SIR2 family protein [Bacillus tropicus]